MKADKETPLMRQYKQLKDKHPDSVLLFRLGDFYETFGDDAVVASKACGITLTKRNNGAAGEIPLAGFPHHQLDTYLTKLVRAGHRVAVCEQLEDPKTAKGIVKRDVVEVVTPGVVMYDKLLNHNSNTYVAALSLPEKGATRCGLAVSDVSTGSFIAGDVELQNLLSSIESFRPAEIIVHRNQREIWEPLIQQLSYSPAITRLDEWIFEQTFAETLLLRHFQTNSLKGFGADVLGPGLVSAGVVLHYIGQTQKSALQQITRLSTFSTDNVMILDAATRRNLEILQSTGGDGKVGALVTLLDRTLTPMGGRLLRWWLQTPLIDMDAIEYRHSIVKGLVQEPQRLDGVREILQRIGDLDRLITKIVTNRANARDLAALRDSLVQFPLLKDICKQSLNANVQKIAQEIDLHELATRMLVEMLTEEPPMNVGTGRMFKAGVSSELDDYTSALLHGKEWLNEYQNQERASTGISTLKVASTGVFGYYIEITNTHKNRAPDRYTRRQTLANAERYTTPELKEFEHRLQHAEDNIRTLEAHLLETLRAAIGEYCTGLQHTSRAIAELDVLSSFAEVANEFKYVQPKMHGGTELHLVQARHPVIEQVLPPGTPYTPNTIYMDTSKDQIQIITGPNMSGKSSYLRQVGLIVFLAHVGSFVPAESAIIPITDRIFTRVGAQDNQVAGESTFLVEMQESANILNNATNRSLILLDEVGRGTATFDGISIAWAIAEYLHEVIGSKTMFATHYHELTALADSFTRIQNYQVEVREVGHDIVFTHRVIPGHSDHSFGIHVARMAGLPIQVLSTARSILDKLEQGQHVQAPTAATPTVERHRLEEAGQISLFEIRDDALRMRVKALDVNNLTPIQAMQELAQLKDMSNE